MGHKPDLKLIAEEVVQATLDSLPPEVGEPMGRVTVFVEDAPTRDDLAQGVGSDWLGIFEGASHAHPDALDPPRIRIWVESLWTFCGAREGCFRDEVRITLLHEIGHYLGLDEEDVAERGLE